MNIMTIIALGIFSIFMTSNDSDDIDFNPKLLQRELSTLCGKDFQMQEVYLPDSIVKKNHVGGKFFTIMCKEDNKFLAYVGRVKSCRAGGCSAQMTNELEGEYEYFDYFILFDLEKKVKAVRVFNYEATHGQEIMVKGWLNQFIGYDGTKKLRVGKEIDSISGATISVNEITSDVQQKALFLQTLEIL